MNPVGKALTATCPLQEAHHLGHYRSYSIYYVSDFPFTA